MSRTSTLIGAGLFLLSAAAAPAAVSTDIEAPSDSAIGSINMDEGEHPKATLPRELPTDMKAQQQQQEPTLPGNPLWAIPLKDLTATRERPIFSQSRRPPSPPVIAVPAAAAAGPPKPVEPSKPQLTLVGTIIGAQQGYGLFQDQAGNKALRLQTGEVHEGWVLREVRARATVFQKNDVRVTLELPAQTAARQNSSQSSNDVTATATETRGRR